MAPSILGNVRDRVPPVHPPRLLGELPEVASRVQLRSWLPRPVLDHSRSCANHTQMDCGTGEHFTPASVGRRIPGAVFGPLRRSQPVPTSCWHDCLRNRWALLGDRPPGVGQSPEDNGKESECVRHTGMDACREGAGRCAGEGGGQGSRVC